MKYQQEWKRLTSPRRSMPIYSNWTPMVKHYCINTDIGATIIAAFNVLTDFAILILPMPLLYKMQKPTKQKIQIMGMFLLGGLYVKI